MVSIGSFRDEGGAMAVRNIPLGVVVEIRFFCTRITSIYA